MYYTTSNKPKHIVYSILDRVVAFACDYLDLDIDLEVRFEKLRDFQYGFCDYDEDEVSITISRNLSEADTIRTIFHELVHVKQYEDGRLEAGIPQRWMGNEYDEDYENLPWEIEAFDLEQKMVDIYSESV